MRAARMFTLALAEQGVMTSVTRVLSEMFGSLGATGKGHGTDSAVLLGLSGHEAARFSGRLRSPSKSALLTLISCTTGSRYASTVVWRMLNTSGMAWVQAPSTCARRANCVQVLAPIQI